MRIDYILINDEGIRPDVKNSQPVVIRRAKSEIFWNCVIYLHLLPLYIVSKLFSARFRSTAFVATIIEEMLMSSAAISGRSEIPKLG